MPGESGTARRLHCPCPGGLRQHASRIHCDMKDALALSVQEFSDLQMTLRTLTERVSS